MKVFLFSIILVISFVPLCQGTETWQETAREVIKLADEIDGRTESSLKYKNADKAQLEARVAKLKKSLEENSTALRNANHELNTLSAKRSQLADVYQAEMADMKTVEGSFRTALRQSLSRFSISPVAALSNNKLSELEELLAKQTFLSLSEMQLYTSYLFEDMQKTREVEQKSVEVIGADGQLQEVDLIRAGGFFLGYQTVGNYFAMYDSGRPPFTIIPNSSTESELGDWFEGKSASLPLDITDGTALRATEHEQGLEEWVEAGGVLLYPILLAGFVGLLFSIGKGVHLVYMRPLREKSKDDIFKSLDDISTATEKLRTTKRCPSARVIEAGVGAQTSSADTLDNIIEEKIMAEEIRLNRFLSIIGVLASIAPLLGLLGTVTGMINTFQAITIFGTGDPRMMSTGISEALVTTQAGLGIAIPLLLAHHFLKRRVAFLIANMEVCGTALVGRLCSK